MTSPPADTPTPPWIPLALVALAAAVRLLYHSQAGSLLLYHEATGDSGQYAALADAIRRDGWRAPLGQAWFQAPFYPFLLALLGGAPAAFDPARWLQFATGIAGTLLAWDTARRLAGPAAGLAAGVLAAVCGPRLFFEGELLSIAWALFFLQAMSWLLLLPGSAPLRTAAAGLLGGLAALAQPNLLLVPVAALAWFGAGALRGQPAERRARRTAVLALALGLAAALAPVALRNRAESGEWILLSANGGINFFIGNNAGADGTFHLPADEPLLNDVDGLAVSAREAAARALGRPVGAAEASSWWFGRGLAFWSAEPIRAAGLLARKVLYFLNGAELPNHYDQSWFRERIPILRVLPGFLVIAPLAAWGLLLLARRRDGQILLLATLACLVSVVAFFVTDRYRLPVLAFFLPAAGVGLIDLADRLRSGAAGRIAPAAFVVVPFLVLAGFPLVDLKPSRAHMHNLVGTLHYKKEEMPAARREFEAALAIDPDQPEAHNNLGRVELLLGNRTEAETHFRRAVELDPRRPEAWFNLEELERGRRAWQPALRTLDELERRVPGAAESFGPAIAYRRGLSRQALGDTAGARAELERAVAGKPDLAGAWGALGLLDARAGRYAAARRNLETAVRLVPNHFPYLYNLGLVAEQTGDYPAALAAYRGAVSAGGPEPELTRARERIRALSGSDPRP